MTAKETINITCNDNCSKPQQLENQYRSLIAKFSHEIRNPLTLISSSLQLVEKECPQVTESSLWPQIKEDLQDTISLLKNLSALGGSSHINRLPVSVFGFLSKIAASFASLALERSVSFTTDFDASIRHAVIKADETKLKEAITNILLNAADAVSENRRQGSITLSAKIVENQLIIHIKDNGPGIRTEYLDHLFDPFVTHKANGTGLGLSIVKNIITQHGGTVSVDTSTASGESFTDFCISLNLT